MCIASMELHLKQTCKWDGARCFVLGLIMALLPVGALQAQSLDELEKRIKAQEKQQAEEKAAAAAVAQKRRASAAAAADAAERRRAAETAKVAEAHRVAKAAAYDQCWQSCMQPQPHACEMEEEASKKAEEYQEKYLEYLEKYADAVSNDSQTADRLKGASELADEFSDKYMDRARSYRRECKAAEDKCDRRCAR